MSKPRYKWWGYVRNMIRAYPALQSEYRSIHCPTVTANISGMPGGGSISDPTMMVAIRELPGTRQREFEAVRQAVRTFECQKGGNDVLRLIDLVFWKDICTLNGAAQRIGVSYETAKRYQQQFILLVAKNYGLLDGVEIQ